MVSGAKSVALSHSQTCTREKSTLLGGCERVVQLWPSALVCSSRF